MHAKPDLRVFLKWMIAGSGSVITDVIRLQKGTMGTDIYAYVECDFQNHCEPFTSVDSVRCINSGTFFIWRDFDLFHTLGLDYHDLDLPASPLMLGRIPKHLSHQILEHNALVLSPHVAERDRTTKFQKFPMSVVSEWQTEQLQCFVIPNHTDYVELMAGEHFLFDPGCELPSFATSAELHHAFDVCNASSASIDYFMAIVALMDSMVLTLSPEHVRLVYWFDCLGAEFMKAYRLKHRIVDNWTSVTNETAG